MPFWIIPDNDLFKIYLDQCLHAEVEAYGLWSEME